MISVLSAVAEIELIFFDKLYAQMNEAEKREFLSQLVDNVQIKKKCGLDVGENFNLTKSENTRQPQCTQEKEDAIMQAFRHFGII